MRTYLLATLFVMLACIAAVPGAVADSVDAGPGISNIAALPGVTIDIHGTYGHSEGMESCALMVKNTVITSHIPTSGVDQYDFSYIVPTEPRFPTVQVVYTSAGKPYVVAREIKVEVLDQAPIVLGPLPQACYTDVQYKPTSVDSSVVSMEAFLDSSCTINAQVGGSFTLPIDKTDCGTHTLYVECVDAQGYCFRTPTQNFSLPPRVKVWIDPNITEIKLGQEFPVYVKLIPGLTISSVQFMVGTDMLGSATTAPWSAKIPLPGYQTGDYTLYAIATTPSGVTFKSESVQFHLTNRPADEYNAAHMH